MSHVIFMKKSKQTYIIDVFLGMDTDFDRNKHRLHLIMIRFPFTIFELGLKMTFVWLTMQTKKRINVNETSK